MGLRVFFLLSCLMAALIPFTAPLWGRPEPSPLPEPAWPQYWEGRRLTRLPLSAAETTFYKQFPGRMARFYDGRQELIIKVVERPTRKLHPAADCYRADGYAILPLPIRQDQNDSQWQSFRAESKHRSYRIEEQIRDPGDKSWMDVSNWYWSALLGRTRGPWQVVTIATPL